MSFIKVVVNTTKDSFTSPFNFKKQLGDSIVGGLINKDPKGAVLSQQAKDAAATAKSQTDAAVAANQLRVSQKRAYQANALALGGFTDDSLGQPGNASPLLALPTALSAGASPAQTAAASYTTSGATTSALGGGATYSGGSSRVPRMAMQR